ncbi:unnamed protein product [Lymnaea stagnalis]|uniref:Uncharacterized protein n=1 Tax=Lymnaea stagnalis TaxID=6523 RepID=A0AAV2GZC0_LYMST
MKKLWKKIKGKDRSGESSPKSGSTRGSLASLNICYDVKEKDLGKLHKAAWNGDEEKVKQLVRKDPSPLDKEKRTPLHLACVRGHVYVVQLLLEWKAKPNIGDSQARTPLMRAVECQQEGCVKLLLGEHVDIDTVDLQGLTPLHLAVESGNTTIIKDLIKAGASLNIKDKEGLAPLHLAVGTKQFEVCELLLKEKADVNLKDNNLRTPLILACHDGSIPIVELLLEYKADASHKDAKGWSADDHAVIQGHHACCQLISDRTLAKRPSSTSTPRSISQPGSSLSTPRDKGFMGLPVADGGAGDDSDNETISKASGAPGSDSWADSPDVSTGEDLKKAKHSAPKISLAKFAKSIHISESDTDGESVRGSTPKRKMSVIDNPMDQIKDQPQVATTPKPENTRQTSWQSQTSGEENSWGDSPVTPRKNNSAQRVSFKKDEELSEIHNITAAEESDLDSNIYATVNKSLKTRVTTSTPAKAEDDEDDGYMPTGVAPPLPPSLDKMRGKG